VAAFFIQSIEPTKMVTVSGERDDFVMFSFDSGATSIKIYRLKFFALILKFLPINHVNNQ